MVCDFNCDGQKKLVNFKIFIDGAGKKEKETPVEAEKDLKATAQVWEMLGVFEHIRQAMLHWCAAAGVRNFEHLL